MSLKMTRRTAIASIAATFALRDASAKSAGKSSKANDIFRHGVASGDPDHQSVVLWTRVETNNEEEAVWWEIARDEAFGDVVKAGTIIAAATADHTAKVVATGLEAGESYFYRFAAKGMRSPVGKTKTLPLGSVEKLGIALASCSNYAFGYFNAYDAIAKDTAIDFVLHTGDYIYEYGADGWGAETATKISRQHEPAHEIVSLNDYRTRHAQYKRDNGSLVMHAAHPLLCCWDDHETANNPWVGGAQNHQPETEGSWAERRAASIQAYYEWMPIREPKDGSSRAEFWRSYVFGDLATLVTLETRHTARGLQVDYSDHYDDIKTQEDANIFMRDVIGDPNRKMLSSKMEDDLRQSLEKSVSSAQPWRLIGNPCPIARMLVPDVARLGVDPNRKTKGSVPGTGADLFWKGQWHFPFYTDTWDGYPAAREAFYDVCKGSGATDLLVLTGDSHSFWANSLADEEGRAMGIELGTAGISSPGDFVESGWDRKTAAKLDRIFEQELDEVNWTDNLHQGYVRVSLTHAGGTADFVAVDTVVEEQYKSFVLKSFALNHTNSSLNLA